MSLSKFDSTYAKKIGQLQRRSEGGNVDSCLMDFAGKNLVSRKVWNWIFDTISEAYENHEGKEFDEKFEYLVGLGDFQMYHPRKDDKQFEDSFFGSKKIYFQTRENTIFNFHRENENQESSLKNDLSILVQDLQYPHGDLDKIWAIYEKNLCKFPFKALVQQYEKMKAIYAKIVEADENGDSSKWYKVVMESGNHEFICANFEYLIGCNFDEKIWWKLYINYLESTDIKKMLETLSKYCRYFSNDLEVKKNYEKVVSKSGTLVKVPWQNPFSWEIYDPKFIEKRIASTTSKMPKIPPKPIRPIQCHFSSKNAVSQKFPFKSSLMFYIQKHASAEILQKLSMTCKLFALKNPYLICYNFILPPGVFTTIERRPVDSLRTEKFGGIRDNGIRFHEQSMEIIGSDLSKLSKIFVSTVFQAHGVKRNILVGCLSKIVRCTAKYISLANVEFKRSEMELLIGHGNVVQFDLHGVQISEANDTDMKLEDLLPMVPKVTDLRMIDCATTRETLQKMLEISFENKFDRFEINFPQLIHFQNIPFAEFIKKNCSSKCEIIHHFTCEELQIHGGLINQSEKFIKQSIECHWNAEKKPKFQQRFFMTYEITP